MTVAVCLSASLLGPSRGHAVRKAAIHRGGSTGGHGRDTRGGGGWTICLEWAALRSMRGGRANRLQTGRHTLRSGGQIHGHPSTHSPANSMGTLRSSPLACVQETEEHRDTGHTWIAQTPPVRVTSSSVLGGGATPSIAPRSLVFRTMCWRACLVLSCLENLMLAGLRTTAPPTWLTLPKLPECGRVAARHAAAGGI